MKKLIILPVIALIFGSCSDFLDREPLTEPTVNIFWKTDRDATQGVNALYTTLSGQRDFWRDCSSDNSVMTNAWGESGMGYISQGTYNAATGYLKEEYKYDHVNWILTCLTYLKGMDMEAGLKARLEGEARFLLAMKYFRMARHFGDIPLIKETPVSLEEANLPVSPKQEVLDYALENVEFAIRNLPMKQTGDNMGRATMAAAFMLKTEIYMEMASRKKFHDNQDDPKLWETAAKTARQLVDSATQKGYFALADYPFIFTAAANNNNTETIFADQFVQGKRTNMLPVLASPSGTGVTGQGWASFCPTRDLVDSYECTDGKTIYESSLYDMNNPWENRDLRLAWTFMLPGKDVLRPNGKFTPYMPHPDYMMPERINNEGGGITGFMYLKYNEPTNNTPSQAWINFSIYRYAEALLFLAEALNEYDPANAQIAWAVNQIRDRAGLPSVDHLLGNQVEMRQVIREERRHEFVAEHKRYFDILRWKIAEDVLNKDAYGINKDKDAPIGDYTKEFYLAQKRTFDPRKNYSWPIPQDALDKNKNLKQSEAWR